MGRYLYSFLIDRPLDHAYKASLLIAGLMKMANADASDILVHHTDDVEQDVLDYFAKLGCRPRRVEPYLDQKYCNKLRQLEDLESFSRADVDGIFLLDIDLAVAEPLDPPDMSVCWGKIVDAPNPPLEVLERLYDAAGIDHPEIVLCEWGNGQTFKSNFNGGFLFIPWRYHRRLHAEWCRLAELLFSTNDLVVDPGHRKHIDQISYGMALSSLKLPFELLSTNWNFPCHRPRKPLSDDLNAPVRVLHYHWCLDEFGQVDPAYNLDDRVKPAASKFNRLLPDSINMPFFERLKRHQAQQFTAPIAAKESAQVEEIRNRISRFPQRLRFILHVGTPKTGTSSLQWHLGTNRKTLAEHGVWYPQPSNTPMPKHQRLVDMLRSKKSNLIAEHLETALADMPPNTHTIFMSTEGIFNHWWDFHPESVGTFKAIVQNFDFELWVCFREPVSFAESLYAQYLTNPNFPGVAERVYGRDISFAEAMNERWFRRHLDYTGFIFQCQEVFGEESVHAFAYHRSIAETLAKRVIDIELPTMPRQNTTMRSPGIEIVRIVNRYKLSVPDKERAENLILELEGLIGDQAKKFSLTDEERHLASTTAAHNWSIAQKFLIDTAAS